MLLQINLGEFGNKMFFFLLNETIWGLFLANYLSWDPGLWFDCNCIKKTEAFTTLMVKLTYNLTQFRHWSHYSNQWKCLGFFWVFVRVNFHKVKCDGFMFSGILKETDTLTSTDMKECGEPKEQVWVLNVFCSRLHPATCLQLRRWGCSGPLAAVQSQKAPSWPGSVILPGQPAQVPEFTVSSSTCEYLWTEELLQLPMSYQVSVLSHNWIIAGPLRF